MQNEFTWTTPDGIEIYAKEWKIDRPKAVIALVHGIGEHCNRYQHVAEYFNAHELAMISFDRRGEGRSSGKRGFTPNYEVLMEEIAHLVMEAGKRYPGVPVLLYGHSLGGNLVLNYLLKDNVSVDGAITTGPWIQLAFEPPRIMVLMAKWLKRIFPSGSRGSGLNVDHISRDRAVVKAYRDDSYVHDRLSFSLAGHAIEAAEFLNSFDGAINVPILLMHGGADKLTSCEASEAFAKRAEGDITFKKWEDFYHEIHNDPGKEEVFDFTLSWIKKNIF